MQEICIKIGQNLRAFRKAQNFTREELAHRSFTSERYIQDLELGKSFATIKVYYKLTKALHLSLHRIFDGIEF